MKSASGNGKKVKEANDGADKKRFVCLINGVEKQKCFFWRLHSRENIMEDEREWVK